MPKKNEMLELKFDANTIEHLGIKMYSHLPQALAELVANGYDADASEVKIKFYDSEPENKRIVIEDDGDGMSFEEINDKFLRIGRKRRTEEESRKTRKQRTITGRKGLGKLALFGIGNQIEILTCKAIEDFCTKFELNWQNILSSNGTYNPPNQTLPKENLQKGTIITLSQFSRDYEFDIEEIAISLSEMFNCFDNEFKVSIQKNDDANSVIYLDRNMRYRNLNSEFSWDISELANVIEHDYPLRNQLKGKIVSSEEKKTMPQNLRGITLYVNGRLANTKSFFGLSEAKHAFSYLSGWIEADFLDEYELDLISTDRQSITWDLFETKSLKSFLQKLVLHVIKLWEQKRKEKKQEQVQQKTGIDIDNWKNTMPSKMKENVENLINTLERNNALSSDEHSEAVTKLHDLIPEYPLYHFRHIHEQIKTVSENYYKTEDYYVAFSEALKRYKNFVKTKASLACSTDMDIMNNAFGSSRKLNVVEKFVSKPDGTTFDSKTLENILSAQHELSKGIISGGRNVISHEEYEDLKQTGLFSEKDCLDLLSLLSHLFKRAEDATIKQTES